MIWQIVLLIAALAAWVALFKQFVRLFAEGK